MAMCEAIAEERSERTAVDARDDESGQDMAGS